MVMIDFNLHDLLLPLSKDHQLSLNWFSDRKGDVVEWKDLLPKFKTNPKGIYCPKNKNYALAVRNNIGSIYGSRESIEVVEGQSGSWYFEYPPEADTAGIDFHTNKKLKICGEKFIPIGFAYQIQNKETIGSDKRSLYKIYGCALPRYNQDLNIFQLYGFNKNGVIRFLT